MAENAITFVIRGQAQAARSASRPAPKAQGMPGVVKAAVRLSSQRGAGDSVRVTAVPGVDVVVLRLASGPVLTLHPHTARDLMLGQSGTTRSASTVDGQDVPVPAQLRWRGLEQAAPTRAAGFLGGVLLQAFEVITGLGKDTAADFVASQVVAKVDGQVDAGVYALQREHLAPLKGSLQKLAQVPAPTHPDTEPLLVLVHGTFVDTFSTFGKLWALHPQRVQELFAAYGDRVYALDHPTLGVSPIANALTLVEALPAGARLHLLTHSRGGLVAEVLALVCGRMGGAGHVPIGEADLAFFAGSDFSQHRSDLQALAGAVKAKGIRVDRIVRVACPARGTLLASQRLDAYLSVLRWTIELSGVPVVPALVDFITEVARRRANPATLPGLAAMIPDTPLVTWLNSSEVAIPGDLRVVAGDLEGDSLGSWLKTLLADAFYWTDNDIVVHTRSMYGGSPRKAAADGGAGAGQGGGASFLLDQSGKTTHFAYFVNERTVQAVVNGLTQDAPAGFRSIGPLSWAGEDSGGLRTKADPRASADKPAVFVLPGILGSHLKAGDKRIWLSLRLIGGLSRLKYLAGGADGVQADGPIGMVYDDLMDHLAQTHEVIAFSFDWRRPIEEEARRLADAVEAALDARNASGQPVRILAHSMGGVLARTLQLERPHTFDRLMQRQGARLLMLGTPNGGSWAPMQCLSGDDTFGNALASFGSPLRDQAARQLMAEFPGFLQLQAHINDPQLRLDQSATWAELAREDLRKVQDNNWWHRYEGNDGSAAYAWGVPPQAVLQQAKALRERLDQQRDTVLKTYADRVLLVVGHAQFTPDGFEQGAEGFTYLNATDGGDGRVPLASALLPGVQTWSLDCEHGGLPDEASAFDAYVELLEHGSTQKLQALKEEGPTRAGKTGPAGSARLRSRPSRARPASAPASSQRQVLSSDAQLLPDSTAALQPTPLKVTVLNGNLSFVRHPLMVGHSRALNLTGTEAVVNNLIGGAMKASLDAGLYPDAAGTHQIFVNTRGDPENPWRTPQPAQVVVAGLGEEGKLSEADLIRTVRQGVIAWVQRRAEDAAASGVTLELNATLMGSGGVGMYPGNAARCVAQGVREANQRLAAQASSGAPQWPTVSHLTLVELYLERASDAWHGLQVLALAAPGHYDVTPTIQSGVGPLRRQIDSGYRGTDYDFITATSSSDDTISFALDTKRARTEVRAQTTQGTLLRELVKRASSAENQDARLGHTLFQLLVPPEVEPFLAGTNRMLLELDDRTASIPWELLDTRGPDANQADDRPWAIRTQLLRKLRQENFRQQVQDAQPDDAVLVVGEPAVDENLYAALPGARAEAQAVAQAFSGPDGVGAERVNALTDGNDATSIINALFERRYRIVHIAGHGEPVTRDAAGKLLALGGVVLSDGTFLGPDEIRSMRTVPELVFVNCCHLAARDSGQTLKPINRAEFAWGVADSLIEIGVRCVIAAGWAVDDRPAEVFATHFYRQVLAGRPFIQAVASAREAAWNEDRNSQTWAAYQAYGDPNWVYRRGSAETLLTVVSPSQEFEGVASPLGLALALEEQAVKSKWMRANPARQLDKIRHLEARFAGLWGGMGAIAEAFGLAYAEAGDQRNGIRWYQQAVQCNDASASMKAQEQLGNLRARHAWAQASAARADTAAGRRVLKQARSEIQAALASLQALALLQPTLQRHSLAGSAWKRLALLETRAGNAKPAQVALAESASAYARAEAQARSAGDPMLFYPALNRMALDLAVHAGDPNWPGLTPEAVQTVRQCLQAKESTDPDFWCYAGQVELDLYEAVAAARLAKALDGAGGLLASYAQLHNRVSALSAWRSVADTAGLVLQAHTQRASVAEAAAAERLLKLLTGFAAGSAAR